MATEIEQIVKAHNDLVGTVTQMAAAIEKLREDRDLVVSALMSVITVLGEKRLITGAELARLVPRFQSVIDQAMAKKRDAKAEDE